MTVKILIKRRFKEGTFKDVVKMLNKFRYDAMDQEGYISSETMWDHDDPRRVVVASMWRDMKNWQNWQNSEARKANEAEFDKLLDGPAEYETFVLGFYPH